MRPILKTSMMVDTIERYE